MIRTGYHDGRPVLPESSAEPVADFVWVDLADPDPAQLRAVAAEFGLPEGAPTAAVGAHQRAKLDRHGAVLHLVLKPVHYVDRDEVVEVTALQIWSGPGFVLTVHAGPGGVLAWVRKRIDANRMSVPRPGDLLAGIDESVVREYSTAIDGLSNDVAEIEEAVFSAGDDDHSERIYKLKREVAEFRRAAAPLERVLERLASPGHGMAEETCARLRLTGEHLLRVLEVLEGIDRLLSDVLAANVARVSSRQNAIALRQNEDMRKISAWAAIALVPTAVAGIYGMNFEHMPELNWHAGYPMALGVIAVLCLSLYRTFRRNKWL